MSFISPIAVPSASTSSIAFASTKLLAATLSKGDRRQETGAGSFRLGIFPKAKERWTTAFLVNSGNKTKRPQPRSIRERPQHRRMRRSGTRTRDSHFTPTALPMPGKSCCGIAKVFGWPFVLTLLPLEFKSSSWNVNEPQPEQCSCSWGARTSRPLPSASRRSAGNNRVGVPFGEWNLPPHLFGETPNRATGTVALPFSDCIVPAQAAKRGVLFGGNHVRDYYSRNRFGRTYPRDHDRRQFKQGVRTPNHGRFDGGG